VSDLRAAVKGLRVAEYGAHALIKRSEVLALIPEGAVLVTEESIHADIEAAFRRTENEARDDYISVTHLADIFDDMEAAILCHLREMP
jgi:hypothetical protein